MATVDKNFKVKHGLIVEGTTATVNNDNVLTENATQILNNKTVQNTLAFNDGTGNGGSVYVEGNNLTVAANNTIYLNTSNGDIDLQPDGNARIWGAIIATQSYVDTAVPDNTDGLSEGTTNKYFTNQRALDATASAYDAAGAAATAEQNAKNYANGLASNYDPAGAAATAKTEAISSANSYTDTAVANLVDGAPALLNTLNELAAAIADDPNYATTIATNLSGKQNTLTAGTGITLDALTSTISVTANTYDAYGAASTAETNAKTYADNNFVTTSSLTSTLGSYIASSQKGQANGVAELDANGYVPLSQLGNIPSAYITSVGSNLSVNNGELDLAGNPTFEVVNINSVAQQIATVSTGVSAGVSGIVGRFNPALYRSAKLTVKVSDGTNTEVSEILLTLDSSNNIAITEYGIVSTNGTMSAITAEYSTGQILLKVTPTYLSDVTVIGTLF